MEFAAQRPALYLGDFDFFMLRYFSAAFAELFEV